MKLRYENKEEIFKVKTKCKKFQGQSKWKNQKQRK